MGITQYEDEWNSTKEYGGYVKKYEGNNKFNNFHV